MKNPFAHGTPRRVPSRLDAVASLLVLLLVWPVSLAAGPIAPKKVLLFIKQNGFIHTDTDTCAAILMKYLNARGFAAEATKDSLAFTPANLARFGVVVFYNTNYRKGALLDHNEEAAMEGFVHAGGGFVGIHSAVPLNGTWEETVWPWYARLFGARFSQHPAYSGGTLVIEDTTHASTRGLPKRIALKDEWYQVQADPRGQPGVKLLASLDTASYTLSRLSGDHPISWCANFEGGRSWVTLVGHDRASFAVTAFLDHLAGGIRWAGAWDEVTPTIPKDPARPEPRESGLSSGRTPVTWVYRGVDGEDLEIRWVSGRFIEARRTRR